MEIPKPSEDDKERFRKLVPEGPAVEVKPMFGNLAGFVNGNMFVGLFGPAIGVRLAESDRAALLEIEGAGPFGPSDRPMKEYVTVPSRWDDGQVSEWIDKALSHTSAFPPKKKKPAKKK